MKTSLLLFILISVLFFQCKTNDQKAVPTPTENRIVRENKLEGTTSWLINVPEKHCDYPDHQYCRRPEVEAFCSKASYQTGDTLHIFVSTNPAASYNIEIYRMGYYGGNGGRLMKSSETLQGKPQVVPTAGKNNLVECKWDTAYSMAIPKEWVSGVYLGKLTTQNNDQSYVIFILKDQRDADVIFQCSDMTWQAYNRYPYWHSMYDEGQKAWVNTNGARISFDRPYSLYINALPMDFAPLSNGSGEFLLWEFPLAFWLEKEGYDVTYISNTDTHADPNGLLRGKAFLSVGHDEYWTPTMVKNVSHARDEGVNLLFLCGNSVDGSVYLDKSWDGRPNRITGRLPERELPDEEELMGSSSYGVGYGDIVWKSTHHWMFQGTNLKDGDVTKELVGWEYHGYPLKKDTSLVVLGTCDIQPNKFANDNPPAHAVTIYTAAKGNFVFNAGTCFWNLPLSTPPGFQTPVNNQGDLGKKVVNYVKDDPKIQRITKNLLDRAIGGASTSNSRRGDTTGD
ncbi:N,N-dimethylformamidase beta subunit family domain-containing protein [Chryseolinea sp. H1M3-3]|uniref:N,N-dimethylformamidase beta subunit family domain-containing protein n=1 Tax=Chryseolinea sp. H1M3-3 TaxID=3034144 RepID=UPI0023EDD1D5|nr:N,N-dimethylformamidase beta subunit family domain-containing protein [Chryseolinea sp. H1M3-3]